MPAESRDQGLLSCGDPQGRLNQTYLLVLEGLLWRHGSEMARHGGRGTDSSSLGRSPLVLVLLEATINLTIEPVAPGLQAKKKLPGRECNPTHQQIIGLKPY